MTCDLHPHADPRTSEKSRKNGQIVGHEEAGQNTAILRTIVACCLLAGVNPHEYLADVLLRVQTHPAKDIAELLPERWRAAREAERAVEAGRLSRPTVPASRSRPSWPR